MKKKQSLATMLAILILVCLIASVLPVQGFVKGGKTILGDVDGDGRINVRDVTQIQRFLANLTTPTEDELTRAKITGGAVLCIEDATELQRFLAEFGNPYFIGDELPGNPEGTPQLIVEKVKAKPSDTNVAVTISVKNNPGIASLAFDVNYDTNALTLTNFAYNETVISGSSTVPFNANAQPTCLSMVNGTKNISGDWMFATLYFDVKPSANGKYAISLSYDDDNIYNIDETNIAFEVVAGEIDITGSAEPSQPQETYTVTFKDNDGNVITEQTVNNGEAPVYPEAPQKEGYVFKGWDKTVDAVTGDTVITAIYEAATDGPTFVIDNVEANAGATNVAVSVAVKNNPGIASILLEIVYDKENLTLTNFAYNTNALAGSSTVPYNANAFAPCLNMVSGTQNIQGDWTFATLYFDVKDSAKGSCPITVSYDEDNVYNIDEENIPFAITSGSINVK